MKRSVLATIWLLLFPVWAAAATYYCDCDDVTAGGDGSPGDPWVTMQEVFSELPAGSPHTVLLSGTCDAKVALGANMVGKTVTIEGQSNPLWILESNNQDAMLLLDGSSAFDITFKDMRIERDNASGYCYVVSNSGDCGDATVTFDNVDFNVSYHLVLQYEPTATAELNLEFINGTTILYGGYGIFVNTGSYMGDITVTDCVIGKTTKVAGTTPPTQNSFFDLRGVNFGVELLTFSRNVFSWEGDGSICMMDLSYRVDTAVLDSNILYYRATAFTDSTPPIYASCNSGLTFTNNYVYEQMGGSATHPSPGTRGYAGAQDFTYLTDNTAVTVSGNTVYAGDPAAADNGTVAALYVLGKNGNAVTVGNNTVVSGMTGIELKTATASSGAVSVQGNTVTLDNVNAAFSSGMNGIALGSLTNVDTSINFGTLTMDNNYIDATACATLSIGIMLGREVQGAGSTVTNNTFLSALPADLVAGAVTYGFYTESRYTTYNYNKIFSRSAMTGVGLRDCVIEYNSFAYDGHGGAKGMLGFNSHTVGCTDGVTCIPNTDLTVRYNALDVLSFDDNISGIVFAEANATASDRVVNDYNVYALPTGGAGDHVCDLNGSEDDTLADCRLSWAALEALSQWDNCATNDANSVQLLTGIFADPANGDFTPTRYLYGWGAMLAGAFGGNHGLFYFPVGTTAGSTGTFWTTEVVDTW